MPITFQRVRRIVARFGSITICGAVGFPWCDSTPVRTANEAVVREAECIVPKPPPLYSTNDESLQFEGVMTAGSRPSLRLDHAQCVVVDNRAAFVERIALVGLPPSDATHGGRRVLVQGFVRNDGGPLRLEVVSSSTVL
jgi:hypothetical protein